MEILHDIIGQSGGRDATRARRRLWDYCKYINPKFYRDDRPHLRRICDTLQALYERKLTGPTGKPVTRLMINIGPRMGKSYTLTLFEQWVLGKDPVQRIITTSYNETLSARFSRGVRDGIDATKADSRVHIFSDVFPGARIKYGDASAQMWALEGSYFSFLGAGFGGTITGVGCSIGVIDDPVKNHIEAANEDVLRNQYDWYTDTFLSRIEEGGLQIINMTRWSTRDLCGRLLESEADEWHVLVMPCCLDEATGEMLCPELLSYSRYKYLAGRTSPGIFAANYQQRPYDEQGRLYATFATYDDLPRTPDGRAAFEKIISYTDTADTGSDFLCTVAAGLYQGRLWVLDVSYTDAPMEVTEPETADLLCRNHVTEAWMESNNGGRGFARSVERLLWEIHRSRDTRVIPRNQRDNKEARLLVCAPYLMANVQYPRGWETRWPTYYAAMAGYQRQGKNAHDDAPDATTGLCEVARGAMGGRTRRISGRGRRR